MSLRCIFFVNRPGRESFLKLCAIFHVDVLRDRADDGNARTYPSREIKFMSNVKTGKTNTMRVRSVVSPANTKVLELHKPQASYTNGQN